MSRLLGTGRCARAARRLIPAFIPERLIASALRYFAAHSTNVGSTPKYIAQSKTIQDVNSAVITTLTAVLDRGKSEGVFRRTIDAVDVHVMISAVCFFRVSNRHTFGALFRRDLSDPTLRARHKQMLVDAVLHLLMRADELEERTA